ncbi:cytidine deaminase [bacterium]|nr:cytidine deaminase [bacterium]
MDEQALVAAALAARAGAHAPYSGFRVGAAIACADGSVVAAANLENASLGLSVCAERNAVAAAVFAGRRDWLAIAIATEAAGFTPPCGACLQVLREFAAELPVILVNASGERERCRLVDFLPRPFLDYPRREPLR